MPKNPKTTTVVGLKNLGEIAESIKLRVPKLRKPKDLSGINSTVEEKINNVNLIQEDVANALKYLRDVEASLALHGDNRIARKVVISETASSVKEMTEYLNDILDHNDPIYRQAAALAYLKSVLSQDFKNLTRADEVLRDLDAHGLLVKTEKNEGPIIIGYQHYKVSDKFGMETEDLAEISEVVAKFSRIKKVLVHQQRQEQAKAAESKSTISFDEALSGETGMCLISVPPESFLERDGKENWRGGGQLFVRFTSTEVVPLKGIGSIEKTVADMVGSNIRLPRHTLDKSAPPASSNSFSRVQAVIMGKFDLDEKEAEDYIKLMKTLWWLIHRGIRALQRKRATEKTKSIFRSKANITQMQAFGLNGSPDPGEGLALMEFEGAFRQGSNSIYDLFFLAKFSQSEGNSVIELAEVPPHLKTTLGGFVGKKFLVGDNFLKCPVQLGRILRGIRGQVEMQAELEKR